MKKILINILFIAVGIFACTKKLGIDEFFQCPFLLVNIDYTNIEGGFSNIDHWKAPVKNFRKDGCRWMYYSEKDSNVIIFLGSLQNAPDKGVSMYLVRTCQTEEECLKQSREHDIIETFKYEFMRFQEEGAYATTWEYADSVSNNIVEKLRTLSYVQTVSLFDSVYAYVAYNSQIFHGTEYYFEDTVIQGYDRMYPSELIAELDSCNASLESNVVAGRPFVDDDVGVVVKDNVMSFSGLSAGPVNVAIMSPLGKVVEQHRVSGTEISLRTKLPRGSYIVEISVAGKRLYKRAWVR